MGRFFTILSAFTLLLITSCGDNTKQDEPASFKKGAMLSSLANEVIVPNYQRFSVTVGQLESKFQAFTSDQSTSNFNNLQSAWIEAVEAFQYVKAFEFGPGMDNGVRAAFGTFPCDTSKIEENILQGSYNLASAANTDAIGLPAVEFLLFRNNAEAQLKESSNTSNYLADLLNKMVQEANAVESAWTNGYAATFAASTGTESTSGFSLLVNEFNKEYELAKNAKVGIPIGKQTLGYPQLQYIEAPYAKNSLTILKENILAIQSIFQGRSGNQSNLVGFDDYLIALEREDLVSTINEKLTGILAKIDALPADLALAIEFNSEKLEALYMDMHDLVIHFKTDMTSAFGVLITYQDNDGD